MQQVSVLETNIGTSTTGNSANTQVIFNDAGTLRGDAGLTYNASTDTLTAGSATISGDLTVRTNAISATSSGVGFGITTAAAAIDVVSSFQWRSNAGGTDKFAIFSGGAGLIYLGSTTASALSFLYNGSTAMTLNSTVLAIGVTPAPWATIKALQVGDGASLFGFTATEATLSGNTYYNGGFKYVGNGQASQYQQQIGEHRWFSAANNTSGAGAAIAFGDAKMTLDSGGNLLVGTTNTSSSAGVGFKANYSATVPAFSLVVNDAAGTGAAYTLYNTNAAAYRFYVSNGGTIFATNTTISAISDARLKENVQDLDVGLGAILALKPRKFDWKEGKGKNIKGDRGFIAQEFETVFPNLIDEWKDPAPEGEAPYKSVRQDLVPVLVKAIQELTARVQTLEAR